MDASANELQSSAEALEAMKGFTLDAYRAFLATMTSSLRAASALSNGAGVAVEVLSSIVKAVHDLVRDALSDLIGYVVQSLAEIAATLGAATPFVAAQLAAKTARWSAILGDFVKDLVKSAGTYVSLAQALKGAYDGVAETLGTRLAGAQ